MTFSPSDVPILLVFGQSNAHGHAQPMPENERITSPSPTSGACASRKTSPTIFCSPFGRTIPPTEPI